MKVPIPGKCGMTPDAVDRDANHLGLVFLELRVDFVVKSHLVSADRAPIRWVESQHHRLPAQIAQRKALVRSYGQGEVRGESSGSKDASHDRPPTERTNSHWTREAGFRIRNLIRRPGRRWDRAAPP